MEKNFEKLSIEEMSLVSGGYSDSTFEKIWYTSCALSASGTLLAGVGVGLTAALFGPTCAGMTLVKILG